VCVPAAGALAEIDPAGPDGLPVLLDFLKSRDVIIRQTAARVLGELGPAFAEASVPALTAAEHDSEKMVRQEREEAQARHRPGPGVGGRRGGSGGVATPGADRAAEPANLIPCYVRGIPQSGRHSGAGRRRNGARPPRSPSPGRPRPSLPSPPAGAT